MVLICFIGIGIVIDERDCVAFLPAKPSFRVVIKFMEQRAPQILAEQADKGRSASKILYNPVYIHMVQQDTHGVQSTTYSP